ncbi:MAG: hypothetical protein U0X39_14805 [Bacteroidales bacterium]
MSGSLFNITRRDDFFVQTIFSGSLNGPLKLEAIATRITDREAPVISSELFPDHFPVCFKNPGYHPESRAGTG